MIRTKDPQAIGEHLIALRNGADEVTSLGAAPCEMRAGG
jgi:hypothetical protein